MKKISKDVSVWNSKLEDLGLGLDAGSFGLSEHRDAILEYFEDMEQTKISETEVVRGFQIEVAPTSSTDTYHQLRQKFDGSDSFVSGGHAVRGGGSTSHAQRTAAMPVWVNNSVQLQDLIKRVFPRIDNSATQRSRAGRWLRIIQLYYRMGLTRGRVCKIMELNPNDLNQILLRINKNMTNIPLPATCAEDKRKDNG